MLLGWQERTNIMSIQYLGLGTWDSAGPQWGALTSMGDRLSVDNPEIGI